ncbi:MAG: hypothetical protein HY302_15820 [Opitutae bacterium]|nr:hypothetical protein [Opitutae bacterium]
MAGATTTAKFDLHQAVLTAKQYLAEVYPEVPSGSVLVEEVELTENETHWLITLSFEAPHLATGNTTKSLVETARAWNGHVDRTYKMFKVSAETGRVIAMKIRQL